MWKWIPGKTNSYVPNIEHEKTCFLHAKHNIKSWNPCHRGIKSANEKAPPKPITTDLSRPLLPVWALFIHVGHSRNTFIIFCIYGLVSTTSSSDTSVEPDTPVMSRKHTKNHNKFIAKVLIIGCQNKM